MSTCHQSQARTTGTRWVASTSLSPGHPSSLCHGLCPPQGRAQGGRARTTKCWSSKAGMLSGRTCRPPRKPSGNARRPRQRSRRGKRGMQTRRAPGKQPLPRRWAKSKSKRTLSRRLSLLIMQKRRKTQKQRAKRSLQKSCGRRHAHAHPHAKTHRRRHVHAHVRRGRRRHPHGAAARRRVHPTGRTACHVRCLVGRPKNVMCKNPLPS